MDINTDTTPALHAGSAVRANPLHAVHSTLDIFYITLQIRGKKTKKTKQIKTENNNNNKHNNKKPQSISAPQDPTPQKKEKK